MTYLFAIEHVPYALPARGIAPHLDVPEVVVGRDLVAGLEKDLAACNKGPGDDRDEEWELHHEGDTQM